MSFKFYSRPKINKRGKEIWDFFSSNPFVKLISITYNSKTKKWKPTFMIPIEITDDIKITRSFKV